MRQVQAATCADSRADTTSLLHAARHWKSQAFHILLYSHATTPSPAVFRHIVDSFPHTSTLNSLSCSCLGLWADLRQLHSLQGKGTASLGLLAGLALPDAHRLPLD